MSLRPLPTLLLLVGPGVVTADDINPVYLEFALKTDQLAELHGRTATIVPTK